MEANKSLKIILIFILLLSLVMAGYFIFQNNSEQKNNCEICGLYFGWIENYGEAEVAAILTLNKDKTASLVVESDVFWENRKEVLESTRGTFTVEGNEITYTRLYMNLGAEYIPFDASRLGNFVSRTEIFVFSDENEIPYIRVSNYSSTIYHNEQNLLEIYLMQSQ